MTSLGEIMAALLHITTPGSVRYMKQDTHKIEERHLKTSVCYDIKGVLRAALSRVAKPTDILAAEPPEFPTVAVDHNAGGPELIPLTEHSDFWRIGWNGEAPSHDLVKQWFDTPYNSVFSCLPGRRANQPLNDLIQKDNNQKSINTIRDSAKVSTFRITNPVIDKAQSYAIVLYSLVENGLGGRVELKLLHRKNSEWREVGSRILSES